ncbi:uncharacterized protein LOC144464327 [Epinephelus lanceolatus]
MDESPSYSGAITNNEQALPPFSTQQPYGGFQTVPTPQSLPASVIQQAHDRNRTDPSQQSFDVQPVHSNATTDRYAKEPLQLSKQPDPSQCPVTVKQYQIPTVPTSTVAPIQHVSEVGAITLQPTTKHGPMLVKQVRSSDLNQRFGAEIQGRDVSQTPAGPTSVKGLISLYSGFGSQPSVSTKPVAVTPHIAQTVSMPSDHRMHVTPTQTPAVSHVAVTSDKETTSALSTSPMHCDVKKTISPETPAVKIPETDDLRPQLPVVSSSLVSTPVLVSDQGGSAVKLPASSLSEASNNQSAAMQTELVEKDLSPQTSSVTSTPFNESTVHGFRSVSQDCQQPQATLNSSPARETPRIELAHPESSPPETVTPKGILSGGSSVEPLSKDASRPITGEVITDNMSLSESGMSQQQTSEETKQTILTESVSTGLGEVSTVSDILQEKISQPRSIYIGINDSKVPPVDMEIEPGEPKPYIRLPHIFVSAASSPEEEAAEYEFSQCSKPELPEASSPEDTTLTAVSLPDRKDSSPADIVAKSDILEDARATEICKAEAFIESEQVMTDSTERPPALTADLTHANEHDSQHNLATKNSTIEATLSEAEIKAETTEICEGPLELSAKDEKSTAPDTAPLEVLKPLSDLACQVENTTSEPAPPQGAEIPEEVAHKDESTISDVVLPEEVQSLDKLSSKEVPSAPDVKSTEEVQQLHDKTERNSTVPAPEPSPDKPPTEEITTSKEDSSDVKVDQPEAEQPNEQPGKGIFSMFSGSTATPQQPSSQTGLSILGGILSGPSTKDTPGSGLLSMLGGSNAPSSPGSNDPQPPLSTQQETQGKGLFSMFGGSSSQPPPSPRGPTSGSERPRGPPPKESPGKGLFSMFGTSAPQQPPPRGHPGDATPRGPSTASSIFGGILPGSTTNKETPGAGLFSKFGGLAQSQTGPRMPPPGTGRAQSQTGPRMPPPGPGRAQSQTGPRMPPPGPTVTPPGPRDSEPSGKGLFSIFGGQSQQASEAHPAASKPAESEGGFKVSSVFSLGGNSDGNKSKTGFGLFGMSFMEETKTEPETVVPVKDEISSEQVKPPDTKEENVPSEPQSTSSVKVELQEEQACQDGQYSTLDINKDNNESPVPLTEPHLEVDKTATVQQHFSHNGNASVVVEASVTDMPTVISNLPEEETPQTVKQVSEEQSDIQSEYKEMKDSAETGKEVEIKSTGDETDTAAIKSPLEKTEDMQIMKSVVHCTDKNTTSDNVGVEQEKAVAEGEITIPVIEKQTEEPLGVAGEEQMAVADAEKSAEEPLKVHVKEETAVEDVEKLNEEPLNVASDEKTVVAVVEKLNEEPLKVVGDEQAAIADVGKSIEVPLKVVGDEETAIADVEKSTDEATVADSVIAITEKPTAEPIVGGVITETAVSEPVKPIKEDLKSIPEETAKEPVEAKVELAEASKEPVHGLEKPVESGNSVAVISSSDEGKTVASNSPEIMTSQAEGPLKSPSLGPASPPPQQQQQQQPRPGMARPPGPQGQRMGTPRMGGPQMGGPRMAGPRMAGPRMAGPRMAGPRQPGPQKPPEAAPFSGFMSMFSTPNTPSKPPTVGGFFSSSPGSFFGSSPAPRQPQQPQQQQQQQQQKSSFFGLPSSIATESLTSDLFGIFKGPETTKSEEHQQSGTESGQGDPSATVPVSGGTEKTDAEKTLLSGDEHVKSSEDSEVPEKGLLEEAERKDKTEGEENSVTESTMTTALPEKEARNDEHEHLEETGSAVSDKVPPSPAPETKGMFEIPGLTASKFGFMSVAAEGTSSIGSLFSSTPPPATGTKTPQPQQTDGGLFSGFKSISAGIFQDEKPTGKEEPSSGPSVFGMKLGSMFGNSDPPKAESLPPVVTAQAEPQSPKPADEACEPESDKLSPGSGETEEASDTEGPTETSKTGSCDTLAQSPQSDLPSDPVSLAEGLDKPQVKITSCEADKREVDTPDTRHADLGTEQPKDLLTKEVTKRLVQFV